MSELPFELRDQLSIDTPELVALEFPVAGVGSRSIACIVDYAIQGTAVTLMFVGLALLANPASTAHAAGPHKAAGVAGIWGAAIVLLIVFLFQWGYFTLFEAFWNGQTPGKRLLKLRVIQQGGQQIGFFHSLSRNLLRVVDALPGFYLIAIVSVFVTRRSQRLGDLVAGTIVVHERTVGIPIWEGTAARSFTAWMIEPVRTPQPIGSTGLPADLIARLDGGDLELIENFNARRLDLPYETSSELAERLARQIASKIGVNLPTTIRPESFLELLAIEIRALGKIS